MSTWTLEWDLIWKWVFAGIIAKLQMSHTGLRWGDSLSPVVVIFIRENRDTDRSSGECHVSMKSEIGLLQLQAQEHQGLLARPEA